jgi:hypothetical protein
VDSGQEGFECLISRNRLRVNAMSKALEKLGELRTELICDIERLEISRDGVESIGTTDNRPFGMRSETHPSSRSSEDQSQLRTPPSNQSTPRTNYRNASTPIRDINPATRVYVAREEKR